MKANLNLLVADPFVLVFEGTVETYPDAFIPEMWANESIAILEENMVVGNLVHRDFEPIIASYGDVVNTRKPGEFTAVRKVRGDSVTVQTPTATSIPVVLNQHLHTTFLVLDVDQSKSFKDLVVEYLQPAMLSIARAIDLIVTLQLYQFLANTGGELNLLTGSTADDYILDTRLKMNRNKAYVMGRNLVLGPISETEALRDAKFTDANRVGDDGTALREASLGRKYGFDIFMAQNTPYVDASAQDTVTGAINHSAGYVAGTKSFTVDGLSAAITNGTWISIAGDNTPLQVTSTTGGSTPTVIVTSQGIQSPVVNDAVITLIDPAAVNNSGGYAIDWAKTITYDSVTFDPQVGQGVTFGTSSTNLYGIMGVDTVGKTITLDRPLEAAISNDDTINLLPGGSYNFGFHRNAIALVTRPLALPMPGTGVRAGIANYNNMSMRVTMSYDSDLQGTKVTVDTLIGVKKLDVNLAAVMLG